MLILLLFTQGGLLFYLDRFTCITFVHMTMEFVIPWGHQLIIDEDSCCSLSLTLFRFHCSQNHGLSNNKKPPINYLLLYEQACSSLWKNLFTSQMFINHGINNINRPSINYWWHKKACRSALINVFTSCFDKLIHILLS